MLILPDRNIPRSRALLPVKDREWRTLSQAQVKNSLGHENQTRFRLRALTHDGVVRWVGWFDDRADADAFLFAMANDTLRYERELWDLPVSTWMPQYGYGNVGWRPDFGEGLVYDFATVVFIVSGSTWVVPGDCNGISGLAGEFIDCIAGGSSGGSRLGGTGNGAGAGGSAFARKTSNITLTGGSSININVGVGGPANATTVAGTGTTGLAGSDTWWNASSLLNAAANGPTISCGAARGRGGQVAISGGAANGGAGGLATDSTGDTTFNGGAGASVQIGVSSGAGGGGAPAGPSGTPTTATLVTANNTASSGRTGNANLDGAGSAGVTGSTSTSSNGSNGTFYDATHGFGGGSGGNTSTTAGARSSGSGGSYGSGTGGVSASTVSATAGLAGPGLIVVSYVPFIPTVFLRWHHEEFGVDPVSYN